MKRILIISGLLLAALVALTVFVILPMTSQANVKSILKDSGFAAARVKDVSKIPGGFNLSGVTLDKDEFSTIDNVTLHSTADGKILSVDKMVLTGDWTQSLTPEISGWSPRGGFESLSRTMKKNKINTIMLTGGQLDVKVPVAGLIRLEAKGQITRLPDGAVRLQAVLWSVQQQLQAEINVNGEFTPDGLASIDFEVAEGRLNLASLAATRLGGWLIMNKTDTTAPWTISAQVVAGTARLHGIPLNGLTFSTQGSLADSAITLQAGGAENDKTAFAVDARLRQNGKDTISATLRADHFSDILDLLISAPLDETADKKNSPGAIAIYDSEADTASDLFKNANIALSDLAGDIWMKGALRKTETGAEMDIQQVAIQHAANALGINDFKSSGTLTGLFPIIRDKDGVLRIEQGLMRATGPSALSYTGKEFPDFLQTTRKDALSVLKLFAYDNMEIFISGPLNNKIEGDISMTGKPSSDTKATLVTFHIQNK
jgi:hypothetical protein